MSMTSIPFDIPRFMDISKSLLNSFYRCLIARLSISKHLATRINAFTLFALSAILSSNVSQARSGPLSNLPTPAI